MTSARSKAKPKTTSDKDLVILFFTEGIGAVKDLYSKGSIKPYMLRKAADKLANKELSAFAAENTALGVRGRPAPEIGDERVYKTQQAAMPDGKMSTLFVRLPVDTVVQKKGQTLQVSFEKGRIVLTAAA